MLFSVGTILGRLDQSTTGELWPKSRTKSLEMTSKFGIPVSVTSNPEAGKLAINMDTQRTGQSLGNCLVSHIEKL